MLHAIVKRIQLALAKAFGKGTVPAAYRATWRSFLIPWVFAPLIIRPLFTLLWLLVDYGISTTWVDDKIGVLALTDAAVTGSWAVFLALHAKEHLAQPHAMLVPRFRETYAAVMRTIILPVIILPALAAIGIGASFWGTLTLLASGFAITCWLVHMCPWLAFILIFPFAGGVLRNPLFEAMEQLIRGEAGAAALPLLALAAVAIHRWTLRLTSLNEASFEYNMKFPVTEEANKKIQEQHVGDAMLSIAERLDGVGGYVGDDPRQRIRHWQLGQRTSPPWMCLLACLLFAPVIIVQAATGAMDRLPILTMMMAIAIPALPFIRAFHAIQPRNDMAYESLRPHSKRQFIREWGLAIWSDTAASALTMIAMCVLVSVIFWRDVFSMQGLVVLSLAIGGLALAAGATSLVTAYHRDAGLLIGVLVMLIIAIGAAVGLAMKPEIAQPALLWIGIAVAMVFTGLGLMRLALWAWCERELGT